MVSRKIDALDVLGLEEWAVVALGKLVIEEVLVNVSNVVGIGTSGLFVVTEIVELHYTNRPIRAILL
jgi:hypothetical protein